MSSYDNLQKKEQEFINEFYSYKFVCYKMIMAS